MTDVCLLFQVHQPYRLKDFSFEKIGKDHAYEHTALNIAILNRVADQCYLPANQMLLEAIRKQEGRFKIAFSISGTALEQFFRYRPDVLDSFRQLSETGCVEFLAETYYHSLAGLFSPSEFRRQVVKHEKAIQNLLDVKPTVFRNTELLYSDALLPSIEGLGFKTFVAEGKPSCMGNQEPSRIFRSVSGGSRILARHQELSDRIAFPEEGASSSVGLHNFFKALQMEGEKKGCISLYLDFETFGEHQKKESGIFRFLEKFPEELCRQSNFRSALPSDAALDGPDNKPVYQSETWTSWADEEKDAAAWTGNHLQQDALAQLYACEPLLFRLGKPELLDVWGRLQSSDHFYYMSTRYRDNPVHKVFSPYGNPYDAYLNFMNVLSDFRRMLQMA